MKILHTADWHLGVKTEGRDRLYEQKLVVREIESIANDEDVDVVLICGDIFNNSLPSSEAEDFFIEAVERLSNNGNRVVVVIAGNHDDPKRLTASTHIAKLHNIVLVGDLNIPAIPNLNKKVNVINVNKGYIEVESGDERAIIAALPFPVEYRLKEKTEAKSYSLQVEEWAKICTSGFRKDTFNIFASHLMVSNVVFDKTQNGDYFTSRVGDALTCDKNMLPKADYIALGHIHTPQFVGKTNNIYYPGSIIEMYYDRPRPSVAIIEGNRKGLKNHKIIGLKTPNVMRKVKTSVAENIYDKLKDFSDDDVVELTFVQDEPVSSLFIKDLREKFKCIAKVCFENLTELKDDEEFVVNRTSLSPKELFEKFYQKKKQKMPSTELTELFLEIMEEEDETD